MTDAQPVPELLLPLVSSSLGPGASGAAQSQEGAVAGSACDGAQSGTGEPPGASAPGAGAPGATAQGAATLGWALSGCAGVQTPSPARVGSDSFMEETVFAGVAGQVLMAS